MQIEPTPPRRLSVRRFFRGLGPGLITGGRRSFGHLNLLDGGRRYYSRRLLWFACLLLLIANTINIAADLGGMAEAAELITGVPSLIFTPLFAAVILLLPSLLTARWCGSGNAHSLDEFGAESLNKLVLAGSVPGSVASNLLAPKSWQLLLHCHVLII